VREAARRVGRSRGASKRGRHERPRRHPLVAAALLLAAGCASPRPSELPRDEPWLVVVKSARLPSFAGWYGAFAHHTWIDVKRGKEDEWQRVEVAGQHSGVIVSSVDAEECRADLWQVERAVHVLGVVEGEAARRIAEQLPRVAAAHEAEYAESYRRWPGPNSNTFAAELAREIPELAFVADPNAIGKDWDGGFGAGLTSSKTGVRADTPVVGFAVGACEGVELHLLGLTLGVSFWPPGLELPFLPRLPGVLATELRDGVPAPPRDVSARFDWIGAEEVATVCTLALRGGIVLHERTSGAWCFLVCKVRVPAHDPSDDPWYDAAPGGAVPDDPSAELDVEIDRHGMGEPRRVRIAQRLGPERRVALGMEVAGRAVRISFTRTGETLDVAVTTGAP
jgi:hypothetical protein